MDVLDNAHQGFLDGEIGIVYLQHHLTLFSFYQENLCLAGIIAQALDATIDPAFQHEVTIIYLIVLRSLVWSDGYIVGRSCRLMHVHSYRCIEILLACLCLGQIHYYLSSLISSVLFLPKITHLPPS